MSTLNVSNITDGTNSVETVYVARGSAKAWVNFNGTGTIAARDSLNVSSLIDSATGYYTVSLTSAFGAADYAVSVSSSNGLLFSFSSSKANPTAAGSFSLLTSDGTPVIADAPEVSSLALGDLA